MLDAHAVARPLLDLIKIALVGVLRVIPVARPTNGRSSLIVTVKRPHAL
jgi:hypothetical protein